MLFGNSYWKRKRSTSHNNFPKNFIISNWSNIYAQIIIRFGYVFSIYNFKYSMYIPYALYINTYDNIANLILLAKANTNNITIFQYW